LLVKNEGEEAANQILFDESRKLSLVFRRIETCGKPWVARSTARRWAAASN
jgi:3-hydroxyacyl-CoA dehydrogenase/enoyl-CoA hydratase/3-hydroxybutyryl-CoA epimerase